MNNSFKICLQFVGGAFFPALGFDLVPWNVVDTDDFGFITGTGITARVSSHNVSENPAKALKNRA